MSDTFKNAIDVLKGMGTGKLTGCISTGSGQALPIGQSLVKSQISYNEIPGLADPGIPGHGGILQIISGGHGDWALWTGRRHFYQGHSYEEIGYYIDLSHELGAENLICINAAGGLDKSLTMGDLVAIDKFKCFIPIPGTDRQVDGGQFRETSPVIKEKLLKAGSSPGINIKSGNYVGVPGPTYETAAEVDWLLKLGCQVVGMSTVPELIRAQELGMNAFALSAIANVHGKSTSLSHEEVVKSAETGVESLGKLITEFIRTFDM
jgi:purine-nucleoside phosphorylase